LNFNRRKQEETEKESSRLCLLSSVLKLFEPKRKLDKVHIHCDIHTTKNDNNFERKEND